MDICFGGTSDLGCGVRNGVEKGLEVFLPLETLLVTGIFSFTSEFLVSELEQTIGAASEDLDAFWTGDTNGFFNVPPGDDCKSWVRLIRDRNIKYAKYLTDEGRTEECSFPAQFFVRSVWLENQLDLKTNKRKSELCKIKAIIKLVVVVIILHVRKHSGFLHLFEESVNALENGIRDVIAV